jgi:hypothetical protein
MHVSTTVEARRSRGLKRFFKAPLSSGTRGDWRAKYSGCCAEKMPEMANLIDGIPGKLEGCDNTDKSQLLFSVFAS